MNPDWEYRYIPNSRMRSYIDSLPPTVIQNFDNSVSAMNRSDIWREAIIYQHGGLWADLDSICIFPIDKVIEKNIDKEMICLPPVFKFGMDKNNNYEHISTELAIQKILNKEICEYWVSNAVFLGKKHNIISEEIFKSINGKWAFKERSFMSARAELHEKYYDIMSLELICAMHEGRFNDRNY